MPSFPDDFSLSIEGKAFKISLSIIALSHLRHVYTYLYVIRLYNTS